MFSSYVGELVGDVCKARRPHTIRRMAMFGVTRAVESGWFVSGEVGALRRSHSQRTIAARS